jgi:hypothetical protein
MSKLGIKLKLDVTKIQKELLYVGTKGKYLDATVFIDTENEDQYGNHGMITQDVSKESREAGEKGPILGNAKIFFRDAPQQQKAAQKQAETVEAFDDDLPF